MNDFTKEELDDILLWADAYTEFGQSWTFDNHTELIMKIQFMKDNYCDHIWNANPYDFVISCKICGKTTSSDSQGKFINE